MLSISPQNIIYKNFSYKTTTKQPPVNSTSNSKDVSLLCYPKNYYTAGFTGTKMISLQEQLAKIDFNAVPKRVMDKIQKELETDNPRNFYEIHKEVYSPLLECKTLDEAKAMFPEFEGVIDAKDLAENDITPSIKKVKRGKVYGVKIEDLSLELLKSHYGRGLSPSHYGEFYFNFSKEAVFNAFETLGIKRLDGQYLFLINASSPERRAKNSKAWTPEKRAEHSALQTARWSDEEKRKDLSEKKKQYYIDHPEAAEAQSERMKGRKETSEHKAKISKGMKNYRRQHPEVTEAQQQAWQIHGDIRRKMSEIAKSYPYLGVILEKRRTGVPLSKTDLEYEKGYYGKCEKEIPGFRATVGKTYKRLLSETKEEKG